MSNPYERHIKWWLGEFSAEDRYDWLMGLFQEFNTPMAKFAIGVYRWHMIGEINLENPDDVGCVHRILQVLDATPAYDFFDNVFNEASPDMVCGIIGMSPKVLVDESPFIADYSVFEVNGYDDVEQFKEFVNWCIVLSEHIYNEYASNGSRFYICENEGWWDLPCQTGTNFPLDNYGMSLIAIEVGPDSHFRSITTRWNDNGAELSEPRLKRLLGDKFDML